MKRISELLISQKGFSLVEVIAAVVIASLIISPLLYYLFDSQNESAANQRMQDVQYQGDMAAKDILENLRRVTSSLTAAGDKTIETGTIAGTSGNIDVLIIRFSDVSQITYGAVNNNLYKYTSGKKLINTIAQTDLTSGTILVGNTKSLTNKIETLTLTFPPAQPSSYTVTLQIKAKDVGKILVRPVTITNTFTPRFDMSIR